MAINLTKGPGSLSPTAWKSACRYAHTPVHVDDCRNFSLKPNTDGCIISGIFSLVDSVWRIRQEVIGIKVLNKRLLS